MKILLQKFLLYFKYNFTEWNFINYHFINFWEYDNDLNQINFLKLKNNIAKYQKLKKNIIIIF